MLTLLRTRLPEAARAVAPLVLAVVAIQVLFVHAPVALFFQFLGGSVLAVFGMLLLFTGIDIGILPMGRFIGGELPRRGSVVLVLAVAFALGFATTVAEPDVLVLSSQVESASQGALRAGSLVVIIAMGVGLFAALGLLRVVKGFSMAALLTTLYVGMLLLSVVTEEGMVPLAYDAGSVTTGVLTAPVVLALTLGLASVLSERSEMDDGFGLLGLASIGPIVVILIMGLR